MYAVHIVKFVHSEHTISMGKTSVSALQEVCAKNHYPRPSYTVIRNGSLSGDSVFEFSVEAMTKSANGTGSSKQMAKHRAAKSLIDVLLGCAEFRPLVAQVGEQLDASDERVDENGNQKELDINFVNALLELCVKQGWPEPKFTFKGSSGASHSPEFYITCTLKGRRVEGVSSTKKNAKKLAAEKMLAEVKPLIAEEESPPAAEAETKHYTIDEILEIYNRHKNRTRKWAMEYDHKQQFHLLTDAERSASMNIIRANDSNKEIIHLLCNFLNLKMKKSNVIVFQSMLSLEISGRIDCAFVENEPKVWDDAVKYFKTMLS